MRLAYASIRTKETRNASSAARAIPSSSSSFETSSFTSVEAAQVNSFQLTFDGIATNASGGVFDSVSNHTQLASVLDGLGTGHYDVAVGGGGTTLVFTAQTDGAKAFTEFHLEETIPATSAVICQPSR